MSRIICIAVYFLYYTNIEKALKNKILSSYLTTSSLIVYEKGAVICSYVNEIS